MRISDFREAGSPKSEIRNPKSAIRKDPFCLPHCRCCSRQTGFLSDTTAQRNTCRDFELGYKKDERHVLKLRRIEIIGFKSFSDRSDIVVHDTGVTAIVGPNGCGKSNVSDAIAWVLGEQSAKSLRGEKMEDVIFSGTRNRAPMGMAEVTITLTDTTEVAKIGRAHV